MKTRFLLAPLLLLPGCATAPQPFSPVSEISYSAIGQDPFWTLAIGDDSIVLTRGTVGSGSRLKSVAYPRVMPRTVDGVTRWESGDGTGVIAVEARPGPCTGSRGVRYRDQVTVSLSGIQLQGCGGRIASKGGR
jgi:uncharacterized membrane protein